MIITLIPAYDSEETIAKVVLKAKQNSDKVIVYDDGSEDMTATIAQHCGARVINGGRNMGKGFALKKLFWEVADIKEDDIAVTIDADNQHNPDDILRIIKPIKENTADYVVGVRRKLPFTRRIMNAIIDFMLGNKSETQSGFRAYSGKAIWAIKINQTGFGVDAEILDSLKDMKRVNVLIDVKYDKHSHAKNIIQHFMELLGFVVWRNPLMYFTFGGIVLFGIGISGLAIVIQRWSQFKEIALGTALFSMVILLIGAISTVAGLIIWSFRKYVEKE